MCAALQRIHCPFSAETTESGLVVDDGKESVELVLELGSMGLVVLPYERSPQGDSALTDHNPHLKDYPRLNVY